MKAKLFGIPSLAASAALFAALGGGASTAWADSLSIEPSVGIFTVVPEAVETWSALEGSAAAALLRGVTFTATGLTTPVADVSVDGQGPGPVRIAFGPVSGQIDIPFEQDGKLAWSLLLSDVAFDVGTKSLTVDLTVRTYNNCVGDEQTVCAAWFSMDQDFDDLSIAKADVVQGSIDGGMPLDNAQVLQTFKPQRLDMSADLYADLAGIGKVLDVMIPGSDFSQLGNDGAMRLALGNLTVSATAVPELSSGGMTALGMVGLAALARRRQARG